MMKTNILTLTDSYKYSHWKQYPEGTSTVYSYFESRGGSFDTTVFFLLQAIIKKYLLEPFTQADVNEVQELVDAHFGNKHIFNHHGFAGLLHKWNGFFPVRIKAVPEGTVVPISNVLMTIENTDPDFPWVTNFLETLGVQVWYGCTVATISRECKKVLLAALKVSGTPELIDFKLHDFGCRGVSSMESAMFGGMAHLVNFRGTDTVPALIGCRNYYNEAMAGFSIPASEHSTITVYGKENEVEAHRNMLKQFPTGLVASVSDSFDIYNCARNIWGTELREEVMKRNGTVVIRPDSGDPLEVVVSVLDILGERFGFTVNSKGYKVLDPHVRVIQGDGINYESLVSIIGRMLTNGWSADNVAFGMGGGLLQQCNRDTQQFAFKCSSATVNGKEVDVYKSPITSHAKRSKTGRLALVPNGNSVRTLRLTKAVPTVPDDLLQTVFENGELKVDHSFANIRERAKI